MTNEEIEIEEFAEFESMLMDEFCERLTGVALMDRLIEIALGLWAEDRRPNA
ncbi:MAG: hypothetical protein AB7T06_47190 [Kofleriaceae bacterium]